MCHLGGAGKGVGQILGDVVKGLSVMMVLEAFQHMVGHSLAHSAANPDNATQEVAVRYKLS